MKRWRERDYDPNLDERDEVAGGPMYVEPLATRSRRGGMLLPASATVLAVILVLAMGSRFATYFTGGADSSAEPSAEPTPITWIDKVVTPDPGASVSMVSQISLSANISDSISYYWTRGKRHHFIVVITNTSGAEISLDPCPAYRIYMTGADPSTAPWHALNCAATGAALHVGQAIDLDIVYVPTTADELGQQTLVWEWVYPHEVQALAIAKVVIEP